MPKVSVIIPNYNHALYLEQRIDSVLNQTYQDFEVIILDDNSTDNSKHVINKYRFHSKISHIIYNETNSGSLFKQWVKGIRLAKGDFIWIAESDDFANQDFLKKTFSVIDSDEEIGIVFSNTSIVNYSGAFIIDISAKKKNNYYELEAINNSIDNTNVSNFFLRSQIIGNASSVLFRAKALKSIDFNTLQNFHNAGDRFVYLSIGLHYRIIYLPQVLNYMREHENNTTKVNLISGKIYKDRLVILNLFLDDFCHKVAMRKDILYFFKINFIYFISFCSANELGKIIKRMKAYQLINKLVFVFLNFFIFFGKKNNMIKNDFYKKMVNYFLNQNLKT